MRPPTDRRMLPFDLAAAEIEGLIPAMPAEMVDLAAARGRVLAEAVHARVALPPFARSMMDGYAVRAADVAEGHRRLRVLGAVYAGKAPEATAALGAVGHRTLPGNGAPLRLGPDEAMRIMTGAPLPAGADAVARLEWCREDGEFVEIVRSVETGESVQWVGDDAAAGALLLPKGTRLAARELAVCQACGIASVRVHRCPTVAVLVTGDELVTNPRQSLGPGQIYSVNGRLLAELLAEDGFAVKTVETGGDDAEALGRAVARLAAEVDFLIVTGGVSMGDRDLVPDVLKRLGFAISFHRVWMRPGAPLLAARGPVVTVLALSGNPAACFIQFEVLVRPALRRSMGMNDCSFPSTGVVCIPVQLKLTKHTYVLRARASVDGGQLFVWPELRQSAGVLSNLPASNCLIRVDGGQAEAGGIVPLRWLALPGQTAHPESGVET